MAGKTIVHRAAGAGSVVRTSLGFERSLLESPETRETYQGELDACFLAFNTLSLNAARASIRQTGPTAVIEITKKDVAIATATTEIDFNAVQREWWTAPNYVNLTAAELRAVNGKLKALDDYAQENPPGQVDGEYQLYVQQLGALNPDAADAFTDVLFNGPTHTVLLPVVTFALSVARNYAIPFVIADMGKLFTTNQVISNVPANAQFQIAAITNTIASGPAQVLAWMKSGRYSQSSDGGVQYIQQYTFDSFPSGRYVMA